MSPEIWKRKRHIWAWGPHWDDYYCGLPNKLYAYEMSNGYSDPFRHFVISTQVVPYNTRKKHRDMIVRYDLLFKAIDKSYLDIEVEDVRPSPKNRVVGTVRIEKSKHYSRVGEIKGAASVKFNRDFVKSSVGFNGSIRTSKKDIQLTKIVYPKKIDIVDAGGAGNLAKWRFRQDDIAGRLLQYDLNIFFRIEKAKGKRIKLGDGLYQATPTVMFDKLKGRHYKDNALIEPIPIKFIT